MSFHSMNFNDAKGHTLQGQTQTIGELDASMGLRYLDELASDMDPGPDYEMLSMYLRHPSVRSRLLSAPKVVVTKPAPSAHRAYVAVSLKVEDIALLDKFAAAQGMSRPRALSSVIRTVCSGPQKEVAAPIKKCTKRTQMIDDLMAGKTIHLKTVQEVNAAYSVCRYYGIRLIRDKLPTGEFQIRTSEQAKVRTPTDVEAPLVVTGAQRRERVIIDVHTNRNDEEAAVRRDHKDWGTVSTQRPRRLQDVLRAQIARAAEGAGEGPDDGGKGRKGMAAGNADAGMEHRRRGVVAQQARRG